MVLPKMQFSAYELLAHLLHLSPLLPFGIEFEEPGIRIIMLLVVRENDLVALDSLVYIAQFLLLQGILIVTILTIFARTVAIEVVEFI